MPDEDEVDELTGLTIEKFSIVNDPAIKKKKYLIKTTKTKARGQGQGVGGPLQGDLGADSCICPQCGYEIPHEKGVPCNQAECPECKIPMVGKEEEMVKTKEEMAKEEQEKKDAEKQETKYIVPDDIFTLISEHLRAVEQLLDIKETEKQKEKDEAKKAEETETPKTQEELEKEKETLGDSPKKTETEEKEEEIKDLSKKIEDLEKSASEDRAEIIAQQKDRITELEAEKKKLEKMRGERQSLEARDEPAGDKPVFGGIFFGPSE